jgi:hypothetical protein
MPCENIQWYRCEECYGLWRPEFLHQISCACGKKHDVCVYCVDNFLKADPRWTEPMGECPKHKDGRKLDDKP